MQHASSVQSLGFLLGRTTQLKLVSRVKLNQLFEVDGNVGAVFDAMLGDDSRSEALERREVDFVALDEGFEVV